MTLPGGLFTLVLVAVCALSLSASRVLVAQEAQVPAELQAELLSKLAAYDRNFAARAGDRAHVLLLVKPGHARSTLSAATMRSALARIDRIGGLPHRETVVPFESATTLAKVVRAEKVAVVYLTPGLEGSIGEVGKALAGQDVLTVAAVPQYLTQGAVLAFELESGKPKMAINLAQAKLQNVAFKAEVLKLMKVHR